MAVTKAILVHGTFVRRGLGTTPETYEKITETTSVEPPEDQADDVEVTTTEADNRRKEFIRGLIDSGEATCTVNYNPSEHPSHVHLREDFASGEVRNWQIVLPGAMETIEFVAYVKGLKRNLGGAGDALTADVTWRVSNVTVS